ncbi:hypothetical protein Lser_V15G36153 [Lactuca serriola]
MASWVRSVLVVLAMVLFRPQLSLRFGITSSMEAPFLL